MEEAPLGIRRYGDPFLKKPTEPVTSVTMDIIRTGERLARAMRSVGGVGISAPQIGSSFRMSLVSGLAGTRPDPNAESVLLINPVLIWHGDELETTPEGCLSVHPSAWFTSVARWRRIKIRYQDANLAEQTWTARDYVARIIQHELDHLDGKMITDTLNRQQRRAVERIVLAPPPKPILRRAVKSEQTPPPVDVRDPAFDPSTLPLVIHRS